MEIVPSDWIVNRFPANFIGLSVTGTRTQSTSCQPAGKSIAVMISPRSHLIRCGLGKRCPTELCGKYDERILEHVALFQVLQQGSYGLVNSPSFLGMIILDAFMRIPTGTRVARDWPSRINLYEANPRSRSRLPNRQRLPISAVCLSSIP